MLSFVKLDESGGVWANRDEALAYLAKGYKVYTDVDEAEELTADDLEAVVEYDAKASTSATIEVAVGAEG
ncbi:MAG: hypothetical protein LIP11_07640 [Clostridiales bacterium]|nr:hypothetical protein [Clostridiales bacterium]